jgi:hypothetical protein
MSQLTPQLAELFATRWFHAWNTQDLDAIMACYADTIEHSSPFVARFNAGITGAESGTHDGTLRGKAAVRAYFGRALATNPTPRGIERFQLLHLTTGINSVLVVYRRWTGELAGEIFFLNDDGLIVRSVSHYG